MDARESQGGPGKAREAREGQGGKGRQGKLGKAREGQVWTGKPKVGTL
jgi:hypothetical protein